VLSSHVGTRMSKRVLFGVQWSWKKVGVMAQHLPSEKFSGWERKRIGFVGRRLGRFLL
jgi:hypothetical protein